MEIFNLIIEANDTIVVDNINDPLLCTMFAPISTLDFKFPWVVIAIGVDLVSLLPNSSFRL
jgi:hypothetical protein